MRESRTIGQVTCRINQFGPAEEDMMIILAIKTSCDETPVALFDEDRLILASVVASQIDCEGLQ